MVNEVSTYVQQPLATQANKAPVTMPPKQIDPLAKSVEGRQVDAKLEPEALKTNHSESKDANSSVAESEKNSVNVEQVIKDMKDYVQNVKRDLEFSVDDESGRTIITVKDPETDEIIRQIPPEDLLYVVKALQENRAHLFVEAKA